MNTKRKQILKILAIILAVLMLGSVATMTFTMIFSALSAKAAPEEGTYEPEADLYEGYKCYCAFLKGAKAF